MIVNVRQELGCGVLTEVEIPGVSSWDQIEGWYVKWDVLHYTLGGGKWQELTLFSNVDDIIDWKRPLYVAIEDEERQEVLEEG